jgi:uncharacterized protein involved in exopolysaccharide biosynthesis
VIASAGQLEFEEEVIDLRASIMALWSRRWWIVISVVICMAVFAAIAFLMTPTYRASAVLVPAQSARQGLGGLLGGSLGSLGDLASLAGVNLGSSGGETEESLAVLKSREFTESFIRDRHLMSELFPGKWDGQNQRWKAGVEPPTLAQAYKYFNSSIRSVLQDRKTGLITLQIDWRDRIEAADWANDLVQRLNAEMRKRAIANADASVGYLEAELNKTTVVATREAIGRLMEAQIKQRMLANVTQEYVFRVADRAMAADKNDPLKPKKLMLLAAGIVLGAALGIAVVLAVDGVARKAPSRRSGV